MYVVRHKAGRYFDTFEQAVNYASKVFHDDKVVVAIEEPKPTVALVNKALKKAGKKEKLVRGNGYYYFAEGDASGWYSSSVMVNRVSAFSVARWLEILEEIRKSNA